MGTVKEKAPHVLRFEVGAGHIAVNYDFRGPSVVMLNRLGIDFHHFTIFNLNFEPNLLIVVLATIRFWLANHQCRQGFFFCGFFCDPSNLFFGMCKLLALVGLRITRDSTLRPARKISCGGHDYRGSENDCALVHDCPLQESVIAWAGMANSARWLSRTPLSFRSVLEPSLSHPHITAVV